MYDVDAFLKDHKLAALTVLHLRPTDAWLTRAHSSSTLWPLRRQTPYACAPSMCAAMPTIDYRSRAYSLYRIQQSPSGRHPLLVFCPFFLNAFSLSLAHPHTHSYNTLSLRQCSLSLSLSPIVKRNVRKSFCVCFSQVFYCIVSQSSYKLGISSGLLYRITNRRLPPHRRRRSRCWRRRSWCPTAPCSPSSSLFSPASSLFHGFAAPVLGHDLHDSSHCRWLKFSRPSVATYSPHAVSWNRTRFLS